MQRRIYLRMKSLEQAQTLFLSWLGTGRRAGTESVPSAESLGRVTAEPVFARLSSPGFHAAAMDGIAVEAAATYGVTERAPRRLRLGRDAAWVNTGQPLPEPFDAVIMVEHLHQPDPETVEIRTPAHPWQNVRKVGEDIVATQLLFPQDHRIRPYDIGALLASGVFRVPVWQKPRVVIIPTGSELVDPRELGPEGSPPGTCIIEYNAQVLAALVRECQAIPLVHAIVPDQEKALRRALQEALASDVDLVMINAGSSAGSRDYTVHVIQECAEILVHGVAMMPGKPTILAVAGDKAVVGNPGYPVSAALSFEQFVRPYLHRLQGLSMPARPRVQVRPSRDIPSKLGLEEFLRVNIGRVGGRYVATPLPRAAGAITTLTRAEGILRIPAHAEGVSQDEEMAAEILVQEDELDRTLVFIGSHDMTIDLLGDELRRNGQDIRISSGNVGSLGGLLALRKGICHLCGAHLLDVHTGEYNISYVRKHLPATPVRIYHLVLRDQGLMVAPGNPKRIQGLADLTREDIRFVNRQPGSGTRILLDYHLRRQGLTPEAVRGYDHLEYTHMAVAVDVLSGAADCGLGIHAAAKALGLEFLPLEREQYDLIIPTALIEAPHIQALLATVRTESFRRRVQALGGYDPSRSGQLWKTWEGRKHAEVETQVPAVDRG